MVEIWGSTKIFGGMEWTYEKKLHLKRGVYKNKIDGATGGSTKKDVTQYILNELNIFFFSSLCLALDEHILSILASLQVNIPSTAHVCRQTLPSAVLAYTTFWYKYISKARKK